MDTHQKINDGLYQKVIEAINQQRNQKGMEELSVADKQKIRNHIDSRNIICTKLFESTTIYDEEYIRNTIDVNYKALDITELIKNFLTGNDSSLS